MINRTFSPLRGRSTSSLLFQPVLTQNRTPSTTTINVNEEKEIHRQNTKTPDDLIDLSIDSSVVAQFELMRSKALGTYGGRKGDNAGHISRTPSGSTPNTTHSTGSRTSSVGSSTSAIHNHQPPATSRYDFRSNLSPTKSMEKTHRSNGANYSSTDRAKMVGDGLVFSPNALVNHRQYLSTRHTANDTYGGDDRLVSRDSKAATGNEERMKHYNQSVIASSAADRHASLLSSENEWLRRKIRSISNEYENKIDELELKVQQLTQTNKKLNRRLKKECPSINGITLAQLHHSNERLSAQLSKLEVLESAQANAEKVKECELAILSLTDELDKIESKMKVRISNHENEKMELRRVIDTQVSEFKVKKEDCDKIINVLSAKLDVLTKENKELRENTRSYKHNESSSFQQQQPPPFISHRDNHTNRETSFF